MGMMMMMMDIYGKMMGNIMVFIVIRSPYLRSMASMDDGSELVFVIPPFNKLPSCHKRCAYCLLVDVLVAVLWTGGWWIMDRLTSTCSRVNGLMAHG